MREKRRIILCTGSAGSGRHSFLEEFANITKQKQKAFQIFRLRDWIFKIAAERGINAKEDSILDLDDTTRKTIRGNAIERIMNEMKEPICYVISTPATFKWRGRLLYGLEYADIVRINPDMFVTVIDDVARVQSNLRNEVQWAAHNFTLKDIAEWRELEINTTMELSKFISPHRPRYIIPRDHPPQVLYDLIFSPTKPKAYFSFPITHMSETGIRNAKQFCNDLRQDFVLFDPFTIKDHSLIKAWKSEKEGAESQGITMPREVAYNVDYRDGVHRYNCSAREVEEAKRSMDMQVVTRDFLMIGQSDFVIVYYPIKKLAAGVICEMFYGHDLGLKKVYAWHKHEPSPFFEYLCTDNKVFTNKKDFVTFLKKEAASFSRTVLTTEP